MAGFSAVVVIFKRRATDLWRKADADRFHGMVIHAILASLFCFLPFLVIEFTGTESDALRWCSGFLGVATAVQLTGAIRAESSSNLWIKGQLIVVGAAIVVLQGLNAIWDFPRYHLGLYLIGVFWHVMQAAIVFVMLIWIPASSIEKD